MNLRGLFMAMAMLKVKDNQVEHCARRNAFGFGLSAVIGDNRRNQHSRLAAGQLGEFRLRGTEQFTLSAGDVVLLMSDGFPEMFNPENEMLGFGKGAEILKEIAAVSSPPEIIDRLVETAGNGQARDRRTTT